MKEEAHTMTCGAPLGRDRMITPGVLWVYAWAYGEGGMGAEETMYVAGWV
jgi:hypothetical protein